MSTYTDLLFLRRLSEETRRRQKRADVLEIAVSVLLLTAAIGVML